MRAQKSREHLGSLNVLLKTRILSLIFIIAVIVFVADGVVAGTLRLFLLLLLFFASGDF